MRAPSDPVLTAAQMREAESVLIAQGTSVDELMQRAGRGAASWVWRIAGGRPVTVLCGPGNNGGDGWAIAEAIRARGGAVQVVAAEEPKSEAAKRARSLYVGSICEPAVTPRGEVLVDCLFGTGLTRPLSDDHLSLLQCLSASHDKLIAVDLPSGVESDLGLALNPSLPRNTATIALGAWKPAHFLMPAAAAMGDMRLVSIGLQPQEEAARVIGQPRLEAPPADAHKYTRGMVGIAAGAMAGAALLAAKAAQGAGAGYVRLLAAAPLAVPPELVTDERPLSEGLADRRFSALLIGPGLGRDAAAREALALVLAQQRPTVIDADALVLLGPRGLAERSAALIATPHDGELFSLERAFDLGGSGSKVGRAQALSQATGMVIVAKGPDTVVAAPDGQLAYAPRGSSWLSTAGTGDVLAGVIASRLAAGASAFEAACQGLWLHGEAARICLPPFSASQLAGAVRDAYAACL